MRADTPGSESHDAFLRMLPRIRQFAARRFRAHGVEAREELTAEAVALAFDTYRRLVDRGLPELAYPAPLATFACRQVVSGRRLGGCRNVNDIGSPACEQRHGVRVTSLQRPGADSGRWCELLVEDRTAGPADIAAARIDFRSWLDSLPPRQRQLATTLATGESTGRVARLFRVPPGASVSSAANCTPPGCGFRESRSPPRCDADAAERPLPVTPVLLEMPSPPPPAASAVAGTEFAAVSAGVIRALT